ncbi:hypothetical protein G8O24_37430 [Bradyrhizobium sp. INPA01-394B]|uniref:Uncharacterized protein n=1 Tax=Bradyrhizobium campsiandrae TaxID=1729892 RepID=A0ABR7U4S0_9BRAD|nr:hypothetical protein [Bradyrhizobium campsiandrae]MBC9882983.1 hypothetical protein [Bradyrhizobium campsiandrae]MBC9979016.1 hypothetical protein [Bradyrhizobium campsiandrae]
MTSDYLDRLLETRPERRSIKHIVKKGPMPIVRTGVVAFSNLLDNRRMQIEGGRQIRLQRRRTRHQRKPVGQALEELELSRAVWRVSH